MRVATETTPVVCPGCGHHDLAVHPGWPAGYWLCLNCGTDACDEWEHQL